MEDVERDREILDLLAPQDLRTLEDLVEEIVADMGPSVAGDLDIIAELFDERGETYPPSERLVAYQIAALLRQRVRVPLPA